jgi:hypothetical protein
MARTGRSLSARYQETTYVIRIETRAPEDEYVGRLLVRPADGGPEWRLGVTDDRAAEVVQAGSDHGIPEWVEYCVRETGLVGVVAA